MDFNDIQIKKEQEEAKPMQLIGSRAFERNLDLSSKDWDVVTPYNSVYSWLKFHDTQISWLNIQQGNFPKITARLTNGQIIEFEVVENYASNELLYEKFQVDEWKQYSSNAFGAGQIKMKMTDKNALLALKYSTCFFPVHWAKNINQLQEMKKKLGVTSFAKLLEDEDLRHLIELRSRETLARCLYNKAMRTKRIISDGELKSAAYIQRLYEKYAPTNDKICIDFPLTGIKMDKTKFSTASDDEKLQLIEEQIQLLEKYFTELAVNNAREFAVEAFVTQSVPELFNQSSTLNWLLTRTAGVYSKSGLTRSTNRIPLFSVGEEHYRLQGFEYDIDVDYLRTKLPVHKAPLASDDETNQSTFRNIAIVWTIDHIELVANRSATNFPKPTLPNLPKDIWHVIANYVDDHITLANLEQVCKGFESGLAWEHLTQKCWTEEDLAKVSAEIPARGWKLAFKTLYEARVNTKMYMCHHCYGNHILLSKEEWDQYVRDRNVNTTTEAYEGHCICPLCLYATGSWYSCSAYPTYGDDGEAKIGSSRRCLVQ